MRISARTRPLTTLAVVAVLAASSCIGISGASATPSTPEIEAKRAEIDAARAEMEELGARAELRHEELLQISEALEQTRVQIQETREDLVRAQRELAVAQSALEERAAGIYRSGRTNFLDVFLETTSFADFLTRMEWLRRVNRSDASLVDSVKRAVEDVHSAERALERREQEQLVLRQQAEQKAREVDEALARQEAYVANLDSEIAGLVAAEEERLRREAEERARRAAEEAARRAAEEAARRAAEEAARQAARQTAPSTAPSRSGSGGASPPAYTPPQNGRVFDPAVLGSNRPEAVTVGMKYLGVPYVWGGSTPAGFDCSGLTQYVYREIGVSIPRTSRMQFTVGAYIPPDRTDLMLPGDLVFFGYDGDPGRIHHVGIYVGGGDYLHAPSAGRTVQVESLTSRISRRGDFVGATRP